MTFNRKLFSQKNCIADVQLGSKYASELVFVTSKSSVASRTIAKMVNANFALISFTCLPADGNLLFLVSFNF